MSLYNEIYVHEDVAKDYGLYCINCNQPFGKLQTQDLDDFNEYILKYDKKRKVRLYRLSNPDKKKFFSLYSKKQIEDYRMKELYYSCHNERKIDFFVDSYDLDIDNGGYVLPEAFFPENRKAKLIKDFPHQICFFYGHCKCKKKPYMSIEIKFTDGIVKYIKKG